MFFIRVYPGNSRILRVLCLFLLALPAQAEPLAVVASFSVLGDLTQQIGAQRVAVRTLVGPDGDAHVYAPTPADARALSQSKLFIVNGFKFEGWMDRYVLAAGFKGAVIVATQGITPRHVANPHGGQGEHTEHGDDIDPHAWQDPVNVRIYIKNIADALVAADPAGATYYQENALRYLARLEKLEAEMRAVLASVPPARRKVVTSHDAFGYFGAAFGIEFLAVVGMNTEAEASAADVAALIRRIRKENIPAVFVENITDPRLLEQIRRETSARIGGTLYSDALSPQGGPAASYLDMMQHNARTLASALTEVPLTH